MKPNSLLPTILIVEDEIDLAGVMKHALRNLAHTHQFMIVSDPTEAIAKFQDCNVSLVITDYSFSFIDGIELTAMLKLLAPKIRVLMVTGTDPEIIAEDADTAGVDVLIAKPFSIRDLQREVSRLIYEYEVTVQGSGSSAGASRPAQAAATASVRNAQTLRTC